MLPEFLKHEDNFTLDVEKESYIEKSISEYLKLSQWFFKTNKSAFTKIDEWAKLVFLFWFSFLVATLQSLYFMALAFSVIIVIAIISRADTKALLVSSWAFVPLFTFIIGIPYAISSKNFIPTILQSFKTGIIIMIGEVVIYNSRIDRLFKPFSFFGGLREFTWLVELTLRNILILITTITQILFAKKTRTAGKTFNKSVFVGQMLRVVMAKSMYVSENTVVAMRTRGYSPKNKSAFSIYKFRIGAGEIITLLLLLILTILERILI
ncbi:energy-coupling factor transporter transmembrane component T [Caldicellulosiruptor morganii]|uniref:Energy-coupling factor transporter transmembrane protein EcfT n=1 Tax=Caldicellulosiruptor morganii TaxID=1387555 RepID=A0ABY7BLF9_9FIRM|nr:energy-coupling factor transporter transmembrane component T [Caldicellulosiruptor morganii]WAM33238.1 energy-coupling factor transporter transmembrane protein EcfT [Caldicellulosiruptor morganii]